jgi:SpoVK/Ycf46/Vps4 family AAA+-type ATPase
VDNIDPASIAALQRAIALDPENTALRLHLGAMFLEGGDASRALAMSQGVLVDRPTDTGALRLAVRAARASGDLVLVESYEQLLKAFEQLPAPAPADEPAPATAPIGVSDNPQLDAELDALLTNAAEDSVEVEEPRITLADVGGMEDVKRALDRSFLAPMRNPELRKMYGKSLRGGLLLYGPPGCGKTFLARATAGELGASFFGIGLHEVLDMYLGQSEHNLHEAFERARRNAPCVLFLDEVDAIGQKRSNLARSAARNVVVQLLTELDGIGSDNDGVFVLAATNQPWDVDAALRRPGRLDRTLLVLPPDAPARERVLEVHLRARPVEPVDLRKLAAATDGYSGADLSLVCESAAEYAIEDSLKTGRARPINAADLQEAIKGITPSTRAWFDLARNFVTFANQAGEYDELYNYMRKHKLL